jgi:hypothetical protein
MNVLPVGRTAERTLARAVLNAPVFDAKALLAEYTGEGIQGARAGLTDALTSLKAVEPQLDGQLSHAVLTGLRLIGAKVRPDFSKAQADAWLNAVLTGLSDLPAKCLNTAILDAVHVPFQFPNEVEAKVRDLAQLEKQRIELAVRRLDAMQAEILRQRDCSKRITDGRTEPLTDAEVHRLQRSHTGKDVVRMGLALGYIRAEQLLPPDELTDTPKEDGL